VEKGGVKCFSTDRSSNLRARLRINLCCFKISERSALLLNCLVHFTGSILICFLAASAETVYPIRGLVRPNDP